MKILISVTCILVACHSVRAGDTTAKAASAKASPVVNLKPASGNADATVAKGYTPVTTSVFTASANDHNPFWPIGWVKIENSSAGSDTAPVIPRTEDFAVTSILLNEPPMAVVNGKEMAEGEIAAINLNGQPVMVQLMAVQDGRVILRWQNQNMIVPLRRNEELSRADTDPSATDLR